MPPSSCLTGRATRRIQKALESLAVHYAATTSTQHTQIASAQAELATEQRQSMHLRDVLGEAMEQLIPETYGWRCKIALWLAVVICVDQWRNCMFFFLN